ncbi:hypothetical protein GH146_02800 [archaeon]|jgi:hypothetical protein|nr:hypothetical protein [archaeon]
MGKTGIPGVIIAFVPPWTKGAKKARGYVFKRYHYPTSKAQKAQQLVLTRSAMELYGQNLSRDAFIAAISPKIRTGRGKGPKSTYAKIRVIRHAKAAGTAARLAAEIGAIPAV